MVETFPNYPAHYGTSVKTDLKVLEAEFGDGYTQRAADGINHIRETWDVQWNNLDKVDAFIIIDFLKARGGWDAFYWTPPRQDVAKIWTCKQWTGPTPTPGDNLYNVKAVFREEFDL